jgi:hypothetical protein
VNHKQADFTDGALGNSHGWGGAENTDQTPRRRARARGEHREPCVSPCRREPKGHAAEGFCTARPASPQWPCCKPSAASSPRPVDRPARAPCDRGVVSCSR